MPYNNVRYIAYQVPTISTSTETYPMDYNIIPLRGANKSLYRIPAGQIHHPPQLSGNLLNNLTNDAKTRIQRFIGVLEQARGIVEAGGAAVGADNTQTLKIFMLPEFFFRPDRSERSYTEKEFNAIKNVILNTIQSITKVDPLNHTRRISAYEDWLIVCGTVMSKKKRQQKLKTISSSYSKDDISKQLYGYFNTCFVIKRGKTILQIEKITPSHIDGLPTGTHDYQTKIDPDKKAAPELFHEYINLNNLKRHFFDIGGIHIGLEICKEHMGAPSNIFWQGPAGNIVQYNYGVLKYIILNSLPAMNNKITQVQLLPSGGMGFNPSSFIAYNPNPRRAYAFRNDGSFASNGNYTEARQVLRQVFATADFVNNVIVPEAPMTTTSPSNPYPNLGMTTPNFPFITRNVDRDFVVPRPDKAVAARWNAHNQCIQLTPVLPL